MWRGTASHQKDILLYRDQFLRFFEKNPGAHMTFFGFNPWYVTETIKKDNYTHRPTVMSVPDFLITLRDLRPKLGIVPLVDHGFNRAKSNIAWLELTWAGAVTLVPDWSEWNHPGAITYSDTDSFLNQLDEMTRYSADDLECHHREAWDYIQKECMLSKWNHLREAILLAAIGRGDWPTGEYPIQTEASA
jgi:hypothetical protein